MPDVRTKRVVLCLILASCTSGKGPDRPASPDAATSTGPRTITRTIKQDRRGDIWIAAFDGMFRYDGRSFTNMTSNVSTARFFHVLEDRKGDLWFSSIGSGVYHYDGAVFRHFTILDGLASDRVAFAFEDRVGRIWFGTEDGLSRFDGTSFRTYTTKDGLCDNDINWITEDRTGKLWIGTRGQACVYDGNTFTKLIHDATPFTNVRTIIEDRKGNLWLGGADGLWRHDGATFTKFTEDFVGYVYEDRNGNLWTSSQSFEDRRWVLSRYELSSNTPTVFERRSEYEDNRGMIFGILEAKDGTIWVGALDGVHRYDERAVAAFERR